MNPIVLSSDFSFRDHNKITNGVRISNTKDRVYNKNNDLCRSGSSIWISEPFIIIYRQTPTKHQIFKVRLKKKIVCHKFVVIFFAKYKFVVIEKISQEENAIAT